MNILFLTRRFYPDIGGVEKHVLELSKKLLEKGHSVTVISEQTSNAQALETEVYKGITIYRIPIQRSDRSKKIDIWQWLWNHKELIRQSDVIHCHDVFFWYLPFRFMYPYKTVYTTFHGYESFPIRKKAILVRKLSEKLSRRNIIVGDFISKWYTTKPDIVIYGATNLPNKDQPFKFPQSAVFIGRLDEQTGIATYQGAYTIIAKGLPDFQFTVVGNGAYEQKLVPSITKHAFTASIEPFLISHRFAFISRYLGILEALAHKRLVFAVYDNPVKKDYLTMAPFSKFIVIAKSEKELAEKVLFYLKNPQKEKEIVEKGYEWVKDQTWEHLTNDYMRLWNKG